MVQFSRIFIGVLILISVSFSLAAAKKSPLPLLTYRQLMTMSPEMQSRYVAQMIEMAIELEEKGGHKIGATERSLWEVLFPTLEAQERLRDYGRGCGPGYDRLWPAGPCFRLADGSPCPAGYSEDHQGRCRKLQNMACGAGHYEMAGPDAPPSRPRVGRPPDFQRSCVLIEDPPGSTRVAQATQPAQGARGGAQAATVPREERQADVREAITLTPDGPAPRVAEAPPQAPPPPTDPPTPPPPVQVAPPPPAAVAQEARSCLRTATSCEGDEADPAKHREFVGSGARNCINAGLVLRINPRSRLCPLQQWARFGGRTYTCGGRETLCSPLLFGTRGNNRGICVPIGNQTTRTCLARSRALAVAGDHKTILSERGSQEEWNDWMTQIRRLCEPGSPPGVYHCQECSIIAQHIVVATRDLASFDRERCTFQAGTSATPTRPSATRRN